MTDVPIPSLADFAATWSPAGGERPPWIHHPELDDPLAFLDAAGLRDQLDDLLDTVVALQRAEWLHDGVWLGARAMPEVWRDLLDAARALRVPVPPAIVSGSSLKAQGVFGTDHRSFLHLSTYFVGPASPAERRFLLGRLCGHAAARHVTWITAYALLVDQGGIRTIASRALGPALEVLLAPMSFAARLALSRVHRLAEVSADRAGLLCASAEAEPALAAASKALLRISLGTTADVDPAAWLAQAEAASRDGSPGRYAELLASAPWTHKRLRALQLFARSERIAGLGREPLPGDLLDDAALSAETDRLLQVT